LNNDLILKQLVNNLSLLLAKEESPGNVEHHTI